MKVEKQYRQAILESARYLLKTQGIKGLTITNITSMSNISKRSFYESFSSKEALLAELKLLSKDGSLEIIDERQAIIKAAEEGIAKYGFNNINLDTIAKAAGLKRGVIYKHFNDKYELLEYCIDYQFKKIEDIVNQFYLNNIDDPVEFLKQYFTGYRYFLNGSYGTTLYPEVWIQLNFRRKIKGQAKYLQDFFKGMFTKSLETGIKKGIFKNNINVDAVTDAMLMTVNGMAFFIGDDSKPNGPITENITDSILDMFFNTIMKKD